MSSRSFFAVGAALLVLAATPPLRAEEDRRDSPAIVVYGQELLPGRVGLISGLFFGLSFGMGGIGAGALGFLADREGIEFVYRVCSFLPLIGLFAACLPDLKQREGDGERRQ